MATLIDNNSSLLLSSDEFIRKEINEYAKRINFILAFIQSFIVLIGLLGNILALIIINKKSLRNTSSAVFITYMAIFDSAVLLLHAANLARPRRNLFIHCSLTYLTDLFTFCATWVLVIITLERCVAVYSPFLARRFCTVRSARYSISVLITVAIIIFTSTFPIIYYTKRKKCLIRPHLVLIQRVYQPIVIYGIPDILLLSNLFTVYSLIRRKKEQRISTDDNMEMRIFDVHSSRKQRQLTIMLVTVNFAFYLFTTPAMIIYIAEYSPPTHSEIDKLKRSFLFSQASVLLLQLHNATNFIFFCFAGQRFRQATIQTFHKYSNRFKSFYHRYILCEKHYRLSTDYRVSNTGTTTSNNRSSNLEFPKRCQNRTSSIRSSNLKLLERCQYRTSTI